MPASPTSPDPVFAALLHLQSNMCLASTPEAFYYAAVNETLYLVSYHQAALWRFEHGRGHITAVSGLPTLEHDAPYSQWLHAVFTHLTTQHYTEITPLTPSDLPEALGQHWNDWLPQHALWLPLTLPSQHASAGSMEKTIGGFFLAREEPWQEPEKQLLTQLGLVMVPVWWSLLVRRNPWQRLWARRPRLGGWLMVAILVGLLAVPARQSVLAPAEIIALDSTVVRAPMDGVVDDFFVTPNQPVTPGQPLFTLDAAELENKLQVTEKQLETSQAEYRRAVQKVLRDPQEKARVAILKGRMEQQMADLTYIREQLKRIRVVAERTGLAVFTDQNDWIGRPVKIGERILMLADPEQVELEIRLPVADAITLTPGTDIELFLAIHPNHSYAATLRYASYRADFSPEGVLAYRLKASLTDPREPPRLGLRGTAKIYGEEVSLFYYLLRRPLAMARQLFGW